MIDETMVMLAKDVRGKTLRILEGVTEEQAKYAPPGLNNHILWHAGHSLVVVEMLSVTPAKGKATSYPKDWVDKFHWNSEPAKVKEWPTLGEVKEKLMEQLEELAAALGRLSVEEMNALVGDRSKGRTLRWSILHGLHDEAGHQGEMWLLKKLVEREI